MHPFRRQIVSLTNRQCPNNLYDSICFIRLIHLRVETPVAPLELIFFLWMCFYTPIVPPGLKDPNNLHDVCISSSSGAACVEYKLEK